MPNTRQLFFPAQKLPKSKKTEDWGKKCIDAAEDLAIFRYNGIRESYRNKLINYNLANDILDTKDIESVCNPMGIKGATFPAKMQNYPIVNPKIDLLTGEERKRRFDWFVRVINSDAVSDKQEEKKEQLFEFFKAKIQAEEFDEKEVEKELAKLNKYLNYDWHDLREKTATQILQYLYKKLDLKSVFSRGFEDVLIAGEEIYCSDILGGEPILYKCNPLNIHTVRSGESPWIEDSDIIVEDGYFSPGALIDMYHDILTPDQISKIDNGLSHTADDGFINIGEQEPSLLAGGVIDTEQTQGRFYGEYFDLEGNTRRVRVVWKSFKKVGVLKYYDEQGMPQEMIVGETYKINEEAGEEITWKWISQWWEGTRLGKDIYIKIQPRDIQFRQLDNISKCSPGYTGLAYNTNTSKAKSLMDRMKPYQYLYNVFMYRTELAFAKAKGRIASLDLAMVPDHWDVDKWMYYAEVHGWAIKDSFKEAKKGAAQGKIAGMMQQNSTVLDLELGNYIQQHIMMLNFIEVQLGKIAGVSDQRQGQIENRELVGNVERAVTQSSHITEKWFALHNSVKLRALGLLLETAKEAWKDVKNKQVQYILDDISSIILTIDGPQINEADYGVLITDSASDNELLGALKQLAHAGLQSDKISFSTIMDIYSSTSMSSIRRKIENSEQEAIQRAQEQQQMQQQMQQEMLAAQEQSKQADREFEFAKMEKAHQNAMALELIKAKARLEEQSKDLDHDGIPDVVELERVKQEAETKEKELKAKTELEDRKLKQEAIENEKDRKNKIEIEKIKAKNKPKTTTSK